MEAILTLIDIELSLGRKIFAKVEGNIKRPVFTDVVLVDIVIDRKEVLPSFLCTSLFNFAGNYDPEIVRTFGVVVVDHKIQFTVLQSHSIVTVRWDLHGTRGVELPAS